MEEGETSSEVKWGAALPDRRKSKSIEIERRGRIKVCEWMSHERSSVDMHRIQTPVVAAGRKPVW